MQFFNTTFSAKGYEDFQKLTKKQQIDKLKHYNPLIDVRSIEKALKGVKYGITKRNKKTPKESKPE